MKKILDAWCRLDRAVDKWVIRQLGRLFDWITIYPAAYLFDMTITNSVTGVVYRAEVVAHHGKFWFDGGEWRTAKIMRFSTMDGEPLPLLAIPMLCDERVEEIERRVVKHLQKVLVK